MNCTGQFEVNLTLHGNVSSESPISCNKIPNYQKVSCKPDILMAEILPLAILTALINGFVFFLFYKRKPLRTPGNYVLLSLAVSDFMTGAINIPIFIIYCVRLESELIRTFEVLSKLTAILTAYHILAVTIEKYIAIVKPLHHRSANPKSLLIVIGIIWLVSSIIAILPSLWNSLLRGKPNTHKTSVYLHLGHDVFCFIAVFLIPYVFIVHAQIAMFRAVSSRGKKFPQGQRSTSKKRKNEFLFQERKCIVVFATMAAFFLICWLPWFILSFFATMTAVNINVLPIMQRLSPLLQAFAIIRFSTCIINPFLYTFFKRDFLHALKSTLPCCFKRKMALGHSRNPKSSIDYELCELKM